MKTDKRLIDGVGINDANYATLKQTILNGKTITLWECPFYRKWKNMIHRCYNKKYQNRQPTYMGCSVAGIWHRFTTFRAWMETQDWQDKHLDKDLLFLENKIYSPNTCVFIDGKVNRFLQERQNDRGLYPIGVYLHKASQKFHARGQNVLSGKCESLGYYHNPEQAHQAWLAFKLSQAHILAAEQSDPRVAAALIDRYENYSKYFPQAT